MSSIERIACGHTDCQCFVAADLEGGSLDPLPAYCSDFCRDVENSEEVYSAEACACGHPACDSP